MKTDNLRTLIRESIKDYISEIDEAAQIAANEARIAKCDEAIAARESKLARIDENDELKEMIDGAKIKEIQNEIKELKNAKLKFERIAEKEAAKKAKKSAPKEKDEVVTDAMTEDAPPIDETDVMAGMDVAEETAINESFIKMQKLAGVITETQYNEKKRLIENQLNEEEKTIQAFGPRLMDGLKQNGFEVKMTTNSQDSNKMGEFIKTSDKKLAGIFYDAGSKFIRVTTNRDNQDDAFKAIDSPFVKELLPDGFRFDKQGSYFIELQGS